MTTGLDDQALLTDFGRDGYYFMLAPCSAVTMWLALDQVDDENGCVRYVTGSHLPGMRALGFIYYAASAEPDADAHADYQ